MKKTAFAAFSVLMLAGCHDLELTRGAQWSVSQISYVSAGAGGGEYGDIVLGMRRRQHQWEHHNRYQWGHRPGWNGQKCAPGAIVDPCRPHRLGRRLALMSGPQMNAPALTKDVQKLYAKIGQAYGLRFQAALVLLESLNRAAVGDFGGLAELGLSQDSLAAAQGKGGRLTAAESDRLSRRLGLSQRRLDALIQSALLGR